MRDRYKKSNTIQASNRCEFICSVTDDDEDGCTARRFSPFDSPTAHLYLSEPRIFSSFSLTGFPAHSILVRKQSTGQDRKTGTYPAIQVSPMPLRAYLPCASSCGSPPSSTPRCPSTSSAFGARARRHRRAACARAFRRVCAACW